MNLLIPNLGSTSLKYQILEMPSETVLAQGRLERVTNYREAIARISCGAIAIDGQHIQSVTLESLRAAIVSGHVACIFQEPQFAPKLIQSLDEGSGVRIGMLDPLGAELKPGPSLYPQLLRGLAHSLTECLGAAAGKNR